MPISSEDSAQRKVKESKVKESKYNNPPQEDINYNKSNTREGGGGEIRNIYGELCKHAQIREDVWDAVAISGSFQNQYTQHYREWLKLPDKSKQDYPLNQLNQALFKQCGTVNTKFYHAICWCKDNLLQSQFQEIYARLSGNPASLNDLTLLIKEVGKGKINNPGLFILSRLPK